MSVITVEYSGFNIRSEETISDREDIFYNLSNLFGTELGSWPLNRDFGIDWSMISKPTPDFQAEFTMEVIEKAERFESRVTVTEVTFAADSNGRIVPTICIESTETEDSE